jgi:hypothetical protein
MAVYESKARQERCVFCRKYDLPCNDAVHNSPLLPYVPLVASTNITAAMAYTAPVNEPHVPEPTPGPRPRPDWHYRVVALVLACSALAVALTLIAQL